MTLGVDLGSMASVVNLTCQTPVVQFVSYHLTAYNQEVCVILSVLNVYIYIYVCVLCVCVRGSNAGIGSVPNHAHAAHGKRRICKLSHVKSTTGCKSVHLSRQGR